MTDEPMDESRLVRYLLGEAAPEEQELIEREYVSSPALLDELQAVERELIDRYVRGEAANRAAFHNYHISDKYEAGIVLTGTEVKSAMDGRVQLKEAYISVREGEAWLFNAHISPYSHGNRENHDPLRTRKLLLHKREISRLDEATAKQGMTLVPTQLYLKNGRIKIEVGVARGKKMYDKREAELKRTVERETRAQLKERNR